MNFCPRCHTPNSMSYDPDGDLSCFTCGHIVYLGPGIAEVGVAPDWPPRVNLNINRRTPIAGRGWK